MGGSRSGRVGGNPASEACASIVLSTTNLLRAGLRSGIKGTLRWRLWVDAKPFPIVFQIDTTQEYGAFFELVHRPRNGDRTIHRYNVRLLRTPQPLGGSRWWFECPHSFRKTMKLYLPLGGSRFYSRQAYQLGYASQREDAMGRAQRQAMKVFRRLEGEGNWRDGPPPKPKWMRWRTYDRLADRFDYYNARFDGVWLDSVAGLLAKKS